MDLSFDATSLSFPAEGSGEFNGTSDYIQLPDPFSHTNHTIAAWVYVNDDSTIFDNRDAGNDGIRLIVLSSNTIYYQLNTNDITHALSLNEWYFVTTTYDGTTQKLYVDGSLVSSSSTSQTISTTTDARIGALSYSTPSEYMNGNLANVAIWNRALHPDEINSIMWKSYSDLNAVDKNGLQAWYALDDITGTTVPDSTGNHNGTAN